MRLDAILFALEAKFSSTVAEKITVSGVSGVSDVPGGGGFGVPKWSSTQVSEPRACSRTREEAGRSRTVMGALSQALVKSVSLAKTAWPESPKIFSPAFRGILSADAAEAPNRRAR